MPFRRPGWSLPNGHIVRSQIEAALCEHLAARAEPHDHGTLVFEVEIAPGRRALFEPAIILLEAEKDGRVIIIEPVASARPGGGLRRLAGFQREFGRRYFIIVVARRALHSAIPQPAYDALVPLEDFSALDVLL